MSGLSKSGKKLLENCKINGNGTFSDCAGLLLQSYPVTCTADVCAGKNDTRSWMK